MTEPSSDAPETPAPRSRRGCGLALGIALGVPLIAGLGWWWSGKRALDAQAQAAREAFDPVLQQLQVEQAERPYDIDETIRAVHELERATQDASSLPEWLSQVSATDYAQVAPEVLEARRELLEVLMRLYASQVEMEDQEALWDVSASMILLNTLSVVEVEGSIDPMSPSGAVSVDRTQAQRLLREAVERQEARARLQAQLREAEVELLEAGLRWSEVWRRYLDEWDRLCLARDRAYLAVDRGDWETAAEAAEAAMALAPSEREAHLIRAWAAIEGGEVDSPEAAEATRALLEGLLERHPDKSAPTLLLLGALDARLGDAKAARLHLDQAASLYPKQADQLQDMLDPYKARSWLRKSAQGGRILDLYQSTMLGAGWFSPELQLAKLSFEAGADEEGRRQVLEHFSRRRGQGQWDALVSDLIYAYELLGDDYLAIFPEDHWLDLELKEGTFSSSLSVTVNNRSDRELHNVALVLALRFTDMYSDDLQTFVVGKTQPVLAAGGRTEFGSVDVEFPLFGQTKTTDDIIQGQERAVLVSDEAVIWVDTDRFKRERAEAAARGVDPAPGSVWAEQAARAQEAARSQAEAIALRAGRGAQIEVKGGLLSDSLSVRLPKELLWLRPLFRLRYQGEEQRVSENLIVGDHIALSFEGVGDLDDLDEPAELGLVAATPYGELVMTWGLAPEGTARLLGVDFAGRD